VIEGHADRLGIVFGLLQLHHAVEGFLTALGGNDVALAIPRTLLLNVCFLARDLSLLIFVVTLLDLPVLFSLLHALSVTAVVELTVVIADVKRFVCDLVKEISVV
jgi:hypothetical protein